VLSNPITFAWDQGDVVGEKESLKKYTSQRLVNNANL